MINKGEGVCAIVRHVPPVLALYVFDCKFAKDQVCLCLQNFYAIYAIGVLFKSRCIAFVPTYEPMGGMETRPY